MTAKRKAVASAAAAPRAPEFVRHVKRPEWGVGRVTDVFVGLVRVRFSDGIAREFREDVLEAVPDAEVPEEVRNFEVASVPTLPVATRAPRKVRTPKSRAG